MATSIFNDGDRDYVDESEDEETVDEEPEVDGDLLAAWEAADQAYDAAEEERLFPPVTIAEAFAMGPFESPTMRKPVQAAHQLNLFEEVA